MTKIYKHVGLLTFVSIYTIILLIVFILLFLISPYFTFGALAFEIRYDYSIQVLYNVGFSFCIAVCAYALFVLPFKYRQHVINHLPLETAPGRYIRHSALIFSVLVGFICTYSSVISFHTKYNYCYDTAGTYTYDSLTDTQTFTPENDLYKRRYKESLWVKQDSICPDKTKFSSSVGNSFAKRMPTALKSN